MRILILALAATLTMGCVGTASTAPEGQPAEPTQAPNARTWGAAGVRVERIVDKQYGVACWVARGRYEPAISCLKVTP